MLNNFIDNAEIAYNNLNNKMQFASTNNEWIAIYNGFEGLGNYRESEDKAKYCLDQLSFNNADELLYLGRSYKKLKSTECEMIGQKCIAAANQWDEYQRDYDNFYASYSSRPRLLKLWDAHSTLIIIVGLITLLNGFIVYFGAVIIELLFRIIYTGIKRKSDEFKTQSSSLTNRKNALDSVLYELRTR